MIFLLHPRIIMSPSLPGVIYRRLVKGSAIRTREFISTGVLIEHPTGCVLGEPQGQRNTSVASSRYFPALLFTRFVEEPHSRFHCSVFYGSPYGKGKTSSASLSTITATRRFIVFQWFPFECAPLSRDFDFFWTYRALRILNL